MVWAHFVYGLGQGAEKLKVRPPGVHFANGLGQRAEMLKMRLPEVVFVWPVFLNIISVAGTVIASVARPIVARVDQGRVGLQSDI